MDTGHEAAAAATTNGTGGNAAALLAMLSAVLLFALMDAAMKGLSAHYPPLQVAALRGAASLPLVLLWVAASGTLGTLLRVRWRLHLLRGVLSVAMMTLFVYGLSRVPLSTAYAMVFVAPLLITALAVPVLGERVGPRRWMAIGGGMVGVLVLLNPDGEGLVSLASVALLAAALLYALTAIMVRVLARSDSTQAMVVWLLAVLALGAGLLALPGWVAVAPAHGWLIAAVGVTGAAGQVAITEAFRRGEASLVAPLEYTALVWTLLLDAAVWGVLPQARSMAGALIIVCAGLYLVRRDRIAAVSEGETADQHALPGRDRC